MVSSRSMILAFLLPSAGAVRPTEFVIKSVDDEVAKTNVTEVLPAIAFVDDEVGLGRFAESCPFSPKCTNSRGECATCTRSPWYADDHRCVCGPATSDWMTEDECTKCPGDEVVTTTAPIPQMKYVMMESCDNSPCPEGYERITDEDTCIEAASTIALYVPWHMACHDFDGVEQQWEDVFQSVEVADKPTGCYTYGACRHGCGLYLNTFAHGSNATCGDCYSTSLLCRRKETEDEVAKTNHTEVFPAIAFVDGEVGLAESCPFSPKCTNSRGECATCTRSPWYADDHRCVCGPATSDWMTEDECTKCPGDEVATTTAPIPQMKYIIMESCDNSPCPEGYEPITDKDTCIEAASTIAPHMACHDFDGVEQQWEDVFQSLEVVDKPPGCYIYGGCRRPGCGLYLNTFGRRLNATCGDCYSTSLLCKRKETEVLV